MYPSFLTRIMTTYYSIDIPNSAINDDLQSIYNDVSSPNHGGKYNAIYNVPVTMATNNVIAQSGTDKGINTSDSTNITVTIDPMVNIVPKIGDLVAFNMALSNYFGVYRVENVETSATLFQPYTRLSLNLVPNVTIESMRQFTISECGFVTNYHHIFTKEDTLMIIELQKKIDMYIKYFNGIYDHTLDAHVDSNRHVFLDFDKAFNNMINRYSAHTNQLKINKSYLCDNLLVYYTYKNQFDKMMDIELYNELDLTQSIKYTARIRRLDKTRRRSINNRIGIFRLYTQKELDVLPNTETPKEALLPSEAISVWDQIKDETLLDNIKDSMSRYLKNECIIEQNMFANAVRLSQTFYVLDKIVSRGIKSWPAQSNQMYVVNANG